MTACPLPARLVLAVAGVLCGLAQENNSAAAPVPSPDRLSAVNSLENWIDALAAAESGNRERLVHRDRDGQLYYGCLQFRPRTFRAYVRRFHLLTNASRDELMSRIYDCGFQKHLAGLMLRNDPATWKNWRRTVENRVGLPPLAGAAFRPAEAP